MYTIEARCEFTCLPSDLVRPNRNKASALGLLWELISSGEEALGVARGPGEAAGHRFIQAMVDVCLEETSRADHPLLDTMVISQVPSLSCPLHKGRDPTSQEFERGMYVKCQTQRPARNSHNLVPIHTAADFDVYGI